ncbi:MAG TPA: ParA family protein [Anaerolineae bacterium]|nr:ParA family protein [Anaerolineae bacterium]
MTKIYAIVNQKGGVGKTTSVINMCAYLAASKKRVLMVDLDPQANATSGIGLDKYEIELSTYDILLELASAAEVVMPHDEWHFDLLPANPALAGAEVELVNAIAREYRLHNALQTIADTYDYILIDCPPSLGLLTINALTAAQDGVIIPVQCEYLALEGLTQLQQTVQLVQKYLNPKLDVRGLVLTMYDGRTNLSRQVVEEVRAHFPGKVFRAIIPRSIRLSEAPSFGQPIGEYAPNSAGAVAYKVLAKELVRGDKAK